MMLLSVAQVGSWDGRPCSKVGISCLFYHRWVRGIADPDDEGKTLKKKHIVVALELFQHFQASHKGA
jgi:hypothetical protein